jgi:hypothetical protein
MKPTFVIVMKTGREYSRDGIPGARRFIEHNYEAVSHVLDGGDRIEKDAFLMIPKTEFEKTDRGLWIRP